MRIAFIKTLLNLAKKDKDIILVTGDLGYSVFEDYIKKYPRQFINAGVSEQNMTGVAAGLAMEGKRPVIYSIVPFVTMRNFEMIRNDICYQDLNVKIVGVGAGFSYGPYGHTHHGLEDIGVLRSVPNIRIYTPGDPIETEYVTKQVFSKKGPAYIRLGKAGEPLVHKNVNKLNKSGLAEIAKGIDIAIISCSTMLTTGIEIVNILREKNVRAQLISVYQIKPFDGKTLVRMTGRKKLVITIEEHSVIGGLGSSVAEVLFEYNYTGKLKIIGVPDRFTKVIGTQAHMRRANGLGAHQIARTIFNIYSKKH